MVKIFNVVQKKIRHLQPIDGILDILLKRNKSVLKSCLMRLSGILIFILLLTACKTKQPLLMKELANSEEKDQLSSFFIPILLSKADLERTLNEKIDGTLFEDKITEGSLQIAVSKVDTISIDIKDTTILYRVPLRIFVKKELLVGGIAADGDIALDFQTNYTLNPDWSVNSLTQIVDYKWIRTPKAKVLGFSIPVKAIAERVLNSSAKSVTDAIDKQINESFLLKEYASQAWDLLQQPILISEDYDSKFKFTPTGLAISPFKTEKDTIISTLFVQGKTEVRVGAITNFATNVALLPLKVDHFDRSDKFTMNILSEIPFEEAEKVAIKNFKGETYSFGKRKVVVEDIKLEKEGDVMIIRALTSGDYEGWLLLKGSPFYNKKKNEIAIKDIEFSLDTKNFLLKSAKWLFNGLLTNKLEGSLVYPLTEDMDLIKKQTTEQLANYPLQKGVNLKGTVKDLNVKKAFLKDTSIMVAVELNGMVKIQIDSLP